MAVSRQRRWQLKQAAMGMCQVCGKCYCDTTRCKACSRKSLRRRRIVRIEARIKILNENLQALRKQENRDG